MYCTLFYGVAALVALFAPGVHAQESSGGTTILGLPIWQFVLIILGILVAIGLFICCYWKCRKHNKNSRNKWVEQEEMQSQMESMARDEKSQERKNERSEMYEQMRSKYGLSESSQNLGKSVV